MIEAMGRKALAVRADAGAVVGAVTHLGGPGGRFVPDAVAGVYVGIGACTRVGARRSRAPRPVAPVPPLARQKRRIVLGV